MLAPTILESWAAAFAHAVAPAATARPFAAWCDDLRLPDGPQAGERWHWREHPAQAATIEAFAAAVDGRGPRQLVVVACVQDGKSLCSINAPMIWNATEHRRPMIYGLPDKSLAATLWRQKIKPAIEGSGFGWILPEKGAGSAGGAPTDILFETACRLFMLGAGAKNEAGQAAVTAWMALIDEVDSMRARQINLLLKRIEAYDDEAISVLTSTIKNDYDSQILGRWERGTGHRVFLPCPDCGHYQNLQWDQITYDTSSDKAAHASARWSCEHCGALHDETARQVALSKAQVIARGQAIDASGQITGPAPEAATWSIRWSALDSPRRSIGKLAVQHREAQRAIDDQADHEPMRQFHRDQLCQPYRAAGGDVPQILEAHIARRSAAGIHAQGECPAEACRITVAVDVQKRRCYWLALASDRLGRHWIIDNGREAICGDYDEPTIQQRHAALDRLEARFADGWPMPDGSVLRPERIGIDVNYATDELLPWLSMRWGIWLALRGMGDEQATKMGGTIGKSVWRLPGWVDIRLQAERWRLHHIDTEAVRGRCHIGLLQPEADAGAIQLYTGIAADDELARHLTAEVQQITDKGVVWVKRRRRNDFLDTLVYARAIAEMQAKLGGEREVIPPAPTPTQRQQAAARPAPASTWIGGGRSSSGSWL